MRDWGFIVKIGDQGSEVSDRRSESLDGIRSKNEPQGAKDAKILFFYLIGVADQANYPALAGNIYSLSQKPFPGRDNGDFILEHKFFIPGHDGT